MNDISVYLGRQRGGGVPDQKNKLGAFVVSVPIAVVLDVCKVKNVLLLIQNEECVHEMHSFNRGPLYPLLEILAIFDYVMERETFPAFTASRDLRPRLII